MKKKKIIALLLTAIIMIMVLPLTACGNVPIDLKDYTTITFNGNNGTGTVSIEFDHTGFMNAYFQAKGIKEPSNQKANDIVRRITAFDQTLQCTVTPNNGLKNADEVTVIFTYDEKLAKSAELNLQNIYYTLTVDGLFEVYSGFSVDDLNAALNELE